MSDLTTAIRITCARRCKTTTRTVGPPIVLTGTAFSIRCGTGLWGVTACGLFPTHQTGSAYGRICKLATLEFGTSARAHTLYVNPYFESSAADFAIDAQPYRFNWDSPIAIAPWDAHTVWVGGNVIFQTKDDGMHWSAISPDLTRNVKSHQQPAGGPISLDVSSAEYSDTLLDIEGSTLASGEIWAGTDDGLVQLTRDDGQHWTNVTPRRDARIRTRGNRCSLGRK